MILFIYYLFWRKDHEAIPDLPGGNVVFISFTMDAVLQHMVVSYFANDCVVQRGVVKVGPWGELKPQNLRDIDGNPTQLTEIRIRYSGCVESIKFKYVADGVAKWSSTWGSESGYMAEVWFANFPPLFTFIIYIHARTHAFNTYCYFFECICQKG